MWPAPMVSKLQTQPSFSRRKLSCQNFPLRIELFWLQKNWWKCSEIQCQQNHLYQNSTQQGKDLRKLAEIFDTTSWQCQQPTTLTEPNNMIRPTNTPNQQSQQCEMVSPPRVPFVSDDLEPSMGAPTVVPLDMPPSSIPTGVPLAVTPLRVPMEPFKASPMLKGDIHHNVQPSIDKQTHIWWSQCKPKPNPQYASYTSIVGHAVFDPDMGKVLEYRALQCHPMLGKEWNLLAANEFGWLT